MKLHIQEDVQNLKGMYERVKIMEMRILNDKDNFSKS